MNILFTRFPLESAKGGAEVQTLSLMTGLRDRGHRVGFVGSCPVLLEWLLRASIPVRRMNVGAPPVTKWLALSWVWRQFWMRRALKKMLDEGTPEGKPWDAVCMLSMSEKLLLTGYAVAKGKRVLWIEHDRIGRWLTWNPWLPALRSAASKAMTVAVSDSSREVYLRLGWPSANIVAIPDGIDPRRTGPAKDPNAPAKPMLHVGCVCRLTLDKGVQVLIQAMADIPDMHLTIVGTGRDEDIIKDAAARSPGASRIHIIPDVKEIGDFYRSIDVLALPSIEQDPFGMVAAEAMLTGVPVIVTDACGIAGYLQSGRNALVVHPNNVRTLGEALSVMRDDAFRKKLATEGRATALEHFSATRMIERYETLVK